MTRRERFLEACESLLGQPVVWGQLDCSELVALGVLAASEGKLDQRKTHTAQRYYDETRPLTPLERAVPGDLVLYGNLPADVTKGNAHIIHVAVVLAGGKVLSADGATSRVTDPKVAADNPMAKVTVHESVHFRRDLLVTVHRNTIIDDLDFAER